MSRLPSIRIVPLPAIVLFATPAQPLRIRAAAVRDPRDPSRVAEGVNHADAEDAFVEQYGPLPEGLKYETGFADARGGWRTREEANVVAQQLGQMRGTALRERELQARRGLVPDPQMRSEEFLPGSLQRQPSRTVDRITDDIMRRATENPDGFTLDTRSGELYNPSRGGYAVAPSWSAGRPYKRFQSC